MGGRLGAYLGLWRLVGSQHYFHGAGIRRFVVRVLRQASIAQLVEQDPLKVKVSGSSPDGGTHFAGQLG